MINFGDLFGFILGVAIVVMYIIPIASIIIEKLINFIFRTHILLPSTYRGYVNKGFDDIYITIFNMVVLPLLLLITAVFQIKYPQASIELTSLLWLLILGVPHTLRFLVDVAKNLKINSSTGDSVRLAELEEEIKQLKGDK